MTARVEGVHQLVYALRQHGQDMEQGVADEVARLAQEAARLMRRKAAKGATSELVNSIQADQVDAFTWHVGPHAAHAPYVEDGVKPGGKGLPRFFDPASRSIVEWLQRRPPSRFMGPVANISAGAPRRGSRVFQAAMLELRDRYEGLAWHVRHHGVRAQPFVEPTAREMEPVVLARLDLAVRRVLSSRPDAGGATA